MSPDEPARPTNTTRPTGSTKSGKLGKKENIVALIGLTLASKQPVAKHGQSEKPF